MNPLLHCKVCGFLSTREDQFKHLDGVLVCCECNDQVIAGDRPWRDWFIEAKERVNGGTP